jgi:hypothetical protein
VSVRPTLPGGYYGRSSGLPAADQSKTDRLTFRGGKHIVPTP